MVSHWTVNEDGLFIEIKECHIPYTEEHGTAIITVREFSNVDIHKPYVVDAWETNLTPWSNQYVDCEISGYRLDRNFPIIVYPNGCNSSTEGHVCLEFAPCWGSYSTLRESTVVEYLELTCVVTIVDAKGCDRFPQSFTFCSNSHDPDFVTTSQRRPYFFIQNYVSRRFLQSDTEHLLLSPKDSLTLRVDVVLKEYRCREDRYTSFDFNEVLANSSFLKIEEKDAGDGGQTRCHYLRLDSDVADLLRKESAFFDRISATPMAECESGTVKISDAMWDGFESMLKILFKPFLDPCLIFTFEDLLSVYATADYYCVPSVLETCRRWLRLVCSRSGHAEAISRHADLYRDDRLKEIADDFTRSGKMCTETDEVWNFISGATYAGDYFMFELRTEGNDGVDNNKSEFSNSYF